VSLLITIVGVALGAVYAGCVHGRFCASSRTAWLLMLPVVVVYAAVLLTADTTEPAPRVIQAFAIGALMQSTLHLWPAERERRRQVNATEAAVRAAEEAEVRRRNRQATELL